MTTKLEEKKHNNTIEQIAICVAFCVFINSHVAIAPRNNIDFHPISLSHTKSHIESAEVGKRANVWEAMEYVIESGTSPND